MTFDAVFLSRLQFAWVIGWHILLPAFTVGVASYIALIERLHLYPEREVISGFRISGSGSSPSRSNMTVVRGSADPAAFLSIAGRTAATARIGMAKADRFPKLSITGLLGVASPQLSQLVAHETFFGVAGPSLAGPLFNAQILGFQQKAAEAQARQSLAQYEQTILVAFREVEDALVGVSTAREQADAQERQVNALRSALHLANLRYKGGLVNYLDVLIAQRSLFDAELSLAATRRLHLVSVVQLYKALGGGWSPGAADDAAPVPSTRAQGHLLTVSEEPDNRISHDIGTFNQQHTN